MKLEILSPHPLSGVRSIAGSPVTLGRNPESTIVFQAGGDRGISWDHACITWGPKGASISDLGSTNGTFVNGIRVSTAALKKGDRIELGYGGPELRMISDHPGIQIDKTIKLTVPKAPPPLLTLAPAGRSASLSGKSRIFRQSLITLGRDEQNDVVFGETIHQGVSRFHAEIVYRAGEYQILDKGAAGGTYLNRRAVSRSTICSGDMIGLGPEGPELGVTLGEDRCPIHIGVSPSRSMMTAVVGLILLVVSVLVFVPDGKRNPESLHVESVSESEFIEQAVIRFARTMNNDISSVPESMIRSIHENVSMLTRDQRELIIEKLQAADSLLPVVQHILRQNGLPPTLAYIAFQESRFDPGARSRAGAVGLWQFVKPTGRAFGLKIRGSVDERLDPIKSTHAAARYIKNLYLRYGDLMLVLAAYNYGPGNLDRALRKVDDPVRNRSYWYIVKKGHLPRETGEYVYKIIAGWIVATYPERFGLSPELASKDT